MTDQPTNPADTTKLGQSATRAHIIVALRNLIDDPADLTVVDGGPITLRKYGRTIEITTRDVTDQL